ncbi:hypothetical protein XVE_5005 [Xanthomonas vesicatoria ATCC 35937]|uniref:Uncharacterized protein n=1 Tax=Xanthomonas vesicatoria ATCC 35937 TaxID=925775 RepID=F0BL33_9XANT|nr:hypothetical protein XVE_5005 [Xanthomonas vesicatoria ATCC 35937]
MRMHAIAAASAVMPLAASAGGHLQHDAPVLLEQGADAGLQVCVQWHCSGAGQEGMSG